MWRGDFHGVADFSGAAAARAPEHPATDSGGLQTAQYPGGTAGAGQENTPLGNPDIRIPVVQNPAERPRRGEDDAGSEEKTEREDAETGERRSNGPHEEHSRPEQLILGENLDGGQGSPETQTPPRPRRGMAPAELRLTLPFSFPGFPDDAIPPRDLRRDSRRPEREKRKEKIITLRERKRDSWTDRDDL
ncbi:hypothetical protein NDU88_001159 [Pleurodeles waltl]|uniref:Uncharacterized protein n=1 Tax=Pleurodeles waltl TaxID=8319 RepID=A0AAV7VW40_PLEWA|nr:hypothetical protein NDU88_001159 [Pleurodeles waltl]